MRVAAAQLECDGVVVSIGDRILCRGLSFIAEPGQCWALLGPNGAGKTTLLTALAGLRAPDAGEIRWRGVSLAAWPRRALARERALMPQQTHDEFGATVLETALTGRHPHLPRWQWESVEDERRASRALAAVELSPDIAPERDVRTLSGGERQRLALAALLTQDAELLLLDEPTAHLDLRHQLRTVDLLGRLAREQQKTAIVALHDVNLAARFCDHCLLLRGGEARHGAIDTVITPASLEWLYGHPMQAVPLPETHRPLFVPR